MGAAFSTYEWVRIRGGFELSNVVSFPGSYEKMRSKRMGVVAVLWRKRG